MSRITCLCLGVLTALQAQPPAAKRIEFREKFHGSELVDHYHWLENFGEEETKSWILAQDRYATSFLQKTPGQERLRKRMIELSATDRLSPPQRHSNRFFYQRHRASSPHPLECYRDGTTGEEKVWLDPADVEKDSGITRQAYGVSLDGKLAAYAVRVSGQDEIEIRFREVESGRDLPDRLAKALYGGVSFLPDRSGVYYSVRSRDAGSRIRKHEFGGQQPDREVFGAGLDARVFLGADVSRDGRWLIIRAQRGWTGGDLYVKDLKSESPARRITTAQDAQYLETECGPKQRLVTTTWGAPRKRALMVDLERPEQENWREIVPESSDTLLAARCAGGRVYAHYLHNVGTRIRVFSLEGKDLGDVPMEANAVGGITGDWEYEDAFLSFQTLVAPFRVELFHVTRGKSGVWSDPKIPVNPGDFEVKQVWYPSKDGTKVPMYLVSKKGLPAKRPGPLLLTGYGGFNAPQTPAFSPQAILWAEQGAVWARPNLRGGSEFGEEWHKAGMLDKKQNVFDDFIAAAEWLIANGYTTPERMAISGASNGGLLVGAALTQRPDLFKAVYCGYPDLDMVRYFRYTKNNNPPALFEYGDGSNPAHFPFLRSWSPYERIKEGTRYPAVLLTTGEGDTRVPPQQAVKMAAKLQWATRSKNPILLRFHQKAGHAAGRGMHEAAQDTAAEYAFLMHQVGIRLE
jgi:prolyl oligopeptidase